MLIKLRGADQPPGLMPAKLGNADRRICSAILKITDPTAHMLINHVAYRIVLISA
jgi:hypothetical protein